MKFNIPWLFWENLFHFVCVPHAKVEHIENDRSQHDRINQSILWINGRQLDSMIPISKSLIRYLWYELTSWKRLPVWSDKSLTLITYHNHSSTFNIRWHIAPYTYDVYEGFMMINTTFYKHTEPQIWRKI